MCRTDIQIVLRLFDLYVMLCTVISDFLHWTTWSFSDMLRRIRVTINFVYVGNSLVWYRIHCVCNFDRMVCFLLTFDVFWFCAGFLTRSVSVTCTFSCMNLLQHIKYYQFLYVFGTAQQHPFRFYNAGIDRRSIATGLAFSTHLYDGLAFSSPAFSVVPCPLWPHDRAF